VDSRPNLCRSFERPFNFVSLRPHKANISIGLKLPRSDEIDAKIDAPGLDTLEYSTRSGAYRLSLDKDDVVSKKDVLKGLIKAAYQNRTA
jgi:hypothetical protein